MTLKMAAPITPVTVRGRYFWRGDNRFLIKGVVYQLHGGVSSDPLTDDRLDDLQRDICMFKELGLNALFVYSIDSTRSHNAAMALLAEAGIYVLAGLSTPASGIQETTTFESYNLELLEQYFATIDCMAEYPNTLGLIVADGVLSSKLSTGAAPVIRTVTRDVKKYMATAAAVTGQRQLPVGYSASTAGSILKTTFDYFAAGNPEECIDFFCYNNYSWSGQSSMHISGYNDALKVFSKTHIPVFFSEYGCNLGGHHIYGCDIGGRRIFQETSSIYSPTMTRVFSGGMVYEFFEGSNHYGLVKLEKSGNGSHETVTKLQDFHHLKARLEGCKDRPSTDWEWASGPAVAEKEKPRFPRQSGSWLAEKEMPQSPVNWNQARERFETERWVDVKKQFQDEVVENLIQAMKSQLEMNNAGGASRWRRAHV